MSESFKARMKRLRVRAGFRSQQEAAEAIGCERGTVGMWEAPSSAVDSVGGEYLMRVATAYQVRPEFINTGVGEDLYPWTPEAAGQSHSQSVRLDPEIVRKAGVALALRHKADGGYSLVEHPEEFVLAYELFAAGMPSAYEAPEVADLETRRAGTSPQGARNDERGSGGAPRFGAPREGVRAGRGRKA